MDLKGNALALSFSVHLKCNIGLKCIKANSNYDTLPGIRGVAVLIHLIYINLVYLKN